MTEKSPRSTGPTIQSLLLADHVYKDAASGKFVIAGTFRQLWAQEFPTQYTRDVFVYVAVTGIRREAKLALRYVDLSDLTVLLQSPEVQVTGNDPLATLEFSMGLPGLPMPHSGAYALELLTDGQPAGSLRVVATQLPESSAPGPEGIPPPSTN